MRRSVSPLPANPRLDEAAARRVLLVQAYDQSGDQNPLWTPEDRAWATRLARETAAAGATPTQLLTERTRHALKRLLPRDAAAARALRRQLWRPLWAAAALALGFLCGIAIDAIGSGQSINLLAPPVWAVVVWNLLVYLLILLPLRLPNAKSQANGQGLRAWLARRLFAPPRGTPALQAFGTAWARRGAPLMLARAALLMHLAAAALALGLVAGMFLRGLVLDYRAGWQSTFLEAAQVRTALATLLAPASALTRIPVPDVAAIEALRTAPGTLPSASAKPWIALYAATLLLIVALPRCGLALAAALRAQRHTARFALPLSDPYFERLLRELGGGGAHVQLLPQGAALSPQALLGLRAALARALGEGVQISVAPALAYGDEDSAAAPAPAGTTLRLLCVSLGSTPEDETHGRTVQALRHAAPRVPLALLADEAAYAARFAALPERVAERRAAWAAWANAQGLGFASLDLLHADPKAAEAALHAALSA